VKNAWHGENIKKIDQDLVHKMNFGSLFQRLGDAYRKERFVILRGRDAGG